MKILAVSQYYWPEPFNVSEICEELVKRGHDVTVLTGLPNYPEGEIYAGYAGKEKRRETRNGVNIIRSWLWPRKSGAINRLLNYESFGRLASRVAKKEISSDFDVVIAFEISPVMSASPAISYSRRTGSPLLLYVIDIWPECLLAGGLKRESPVFHHYARVSKRIYESADRLAVTSPLFKGYIEDLLDHPVETCYLPQFAEDIFEQECCSSPEGYCRDKVNFTFAGNIGAAQSVQTIVRAAAELGNVGVLFHIVGSGSELKPCMDLAKELGVHNVVFHGRHPLEDMPAYYSASDALIATFSNSPILGFTLPRKVQSYMAAGKPILGTLVGESRRVIEDARCGFCCDAEDYVGLSIICRDFILLDEAEKAAMGRNARRYNHEHFSRDGFFSTLESELLKIREVTSER